MILIGQQMSRSKDEKEYPTLTDWLATQLELSKEIARIALNCPMCRGHVKITITRIKGMKNMKSSDFSSQEVSQTVFVNPNNNDLEEVAVSNEINSY